MNWLLLVLAVLTFGFSAASMLTDRPARERTYSAVALILAVVLTALVLALAVTGGI